jgi:hypothetical protein
MHRSKDSESIVERFSKSHIFDWKYLRRAEDEE